MLDSKDKKMQEVNNNMKVMLGTDDVSDDEMELLIYVDSDNEEEKINKDNSDAKTIDVTNIDKLSSKKEDTTIQKSVTPIPSTSKLNVETSDDLNKTVNENVATPPDEVSLIKVKLVEAETAPCETTLSDVNNEKIIITKETETSNKCEKSSEIIKKIEECCDKQSDNITEKDENSNKQCVEECVETPEVRETLDATDNDKFVEGSDKNIEENTLKTPIDESKSEPIDDKSPTDITESSEVEASCNVENGSIQGNTISNKEEIDDVIIIEDDKVSKNKAKKADQIADVKEVESVSSEPLVNHSEEIKETISESNNNSVSDAKSIQQCEENDPTTETKADKNRCIDLAEKDKEIIVEEIPNNLNTTDKLIEVCKNNDNDKKSDVCTMDIDQDLEESSKNNNNDCDQADASTNSIINDKIDEILISNEDAKEKPDELNIIIKESDDSRSSVVKNTETSEKINEICNQGDTDKDTEKTENKDELQNDDVDHSKLSKNNSNVNKILDDDDIIDIDEILDSVNEIDKNILMQHENIDSNKSKEFDSNLEINTETPLIDQKQTDVPIISKKIIPETSANENNKKIDDTEDDVVIIDITECGDINSEKTSEDNSKKELLEQPKSKRSCNIDLRETNNKNDSTTLVSETNTSDAITADTDVHLDNIVKKNVNNKRRLSCIENCENNLSNIENLKKTKIDDNRIDDENSLKSKKFKNIIKKLTTVLKDEITITEEPLKLDPGPNTIKEPSKFSADFLRAFNKPLKNMTRKDLEQLVQQKIIEILLCNSELAEVRRKVIEQEQLLHIFRMRCNELQKQFCDLELIHTRIVKDLETKNKNYVAPIMITRTVSVQVNPLAFEESHTEENIALPIKDDNKSSVYRSQMQPQTKLAPTFVVQQKSHRLPVDNKVTPTTTTTAQTTNNNKKSEPKTITNQRYSLPAGIVTRSSSENLRNNKAKQVSPPASNVTTISLPPLSKISDEVSVATRPRVPPIIIKKTKCTTVSENKSTKATTSCTSSSSSSTKQSGNDMKRSFIDLTDEEEVTPINRPTFSIVQHPQQMQKVCALINGQQQTLVTFSNNNNKGKIAYLINNTTTSTGTINGITTTSAGSNNLATLQNLNGKKFVNIAPKPALKGITYTNGNAFVTNAGENELQRIAVKPMNTLCNTHPAPLPNTHVTTGLSTWKKIPPKPEINITLENQGVVIKWTMDEWSESEHAAIARYQLYAYQEKGPPSSDLWRRVGEVKSMKLPMAVTLTQFEDGQMYYFAIRAIDIYERSGLFSAPRPYL